MRIERKVTASFLVAATFLALLFLCSAAGADWRSERFVGPGARHLFLRRESGPWEINILQVNLKEGRPSLATTLADSTVTRNETLSAMASASAGEGREVVGAINGDYFHRAPDAYEGDPLGLHILKGELISFPYRARSSLLITADGQITIERTRVWAWAIASPQLQHAICGLNQPREAQRLVLYTPRFGPSTGTNPYGVEAILSAAQTKITPACEIKARVLEVRQRGNSEIPADGMVLSGHGISAWFLNQLRVGEEIALSVRLEPDLGEMSEAIGGGPRLVRDGAVSVETEDESFNEGFARRRHPRSAVGFSSTSLFFVTVDGRRPGRSEGMSLYELARLMVSLDCKEALNLDGGGSTEMVVRDKIVNSPSDGGERPLANALLLLSDAAAKAPAILLLEPASSAMLEDGQIGFRTRTLNCYYEPLQAQPEQISWKVSPSVGQVSQEGRFTLTRTLKSPMSVEVEATADGVGSRARVTVYPAPVALSLVPESIHLRPGQRQQFIAEGKCAEGGQIPFRILRPVWSCSPEAGEIDQHGYFRAGEKPGEVEIYARVGNALGQAKVIIVGEESPVEQSQ